MTFSILNSITASIVFGTYVGIIISSYKLIVSALIVIMIVIIIIVK